MLDEQDSEDIGILVSYALKQASVQYAPLYRKLLDRYATTIMDGGTFRHNVDALCRGLGLEITGYETGSHGGLFLKARNGQEKSVFYSSPFDLWFSSREYYKKYSSMLFIALFAICVYFFQSKEQLETAKVRDTDEKSILDWIGKKSEKFSNDSLISKFQAIKEINEDYEFVKI